MMLKLRPACLRLAVCYCLIPLLSSAFAAPSISWGQSSSVDKEIELEFWRAIKDSDDPAMVNAYLEQYPSGTFSSLANIKIKKLEETETRESYIPAPISEPEEGGGLFGTSSTPTTSGGSLPPGSSADPGSSIASTAEGPLADAKNRLETPEVPNLIIQPTTEGTLGTIEGMLIRIRELVVQSSSGTLTDDDRAAMNDEFEQLKEEIEQVASTTDDLPSDSAPLVYTYRMKAGLAMALLNMLETSLYLSPTAVPWVISDEESTGAGTEVLTLPLPEAEIDSRSRTTYLIEADPNADKLIPSNEVITKLGAPQSEKKDNDSSNDSSSPTTDLISGCPAGTKQTYKGCEADSGALAAAAEAALKAVELSQSANTAEEKAAAKAAAEHAAQQLQVMKAAADAKKAERKAALKVRAKADNKKALEVVVEVNKVRVGAWVHTFPGLR